MAVLYNIRNVNVLKKASIMGGMRRGRDWFHEPGDGMDIRPQVNRGEGGAGKDRLFPRISLS